MEKMDEKISRTLTALERVKNGVPDTRPKTASETQRRIGEASSKFETGQLTVEEFINKMKYVGWKGVKKQGNNVQAEADLPESDFVDVDLDVDVQDINVDLLGVSLQDINVGHNLQDMLADSVPRIMPTYTWPWTPRSGHAPRSTAAGSPYGTPVTRSAARTQISLHIQTGQEIVPQEEYAPVVAAQDFAGQEAAAKKKSKSCIISLQENILVTRPIHLMSYDYGDICKVCSESFHQEL